MKTLELKQMEGVEGGASVGCVSSAVSLAATYAGAFLIGTGVMAPAGAVIFGIGFIAGSIGLAASC